MSDWFETLEGLNSRLWQCLGRGVADRHHPARHPTLATIGPDGWPEARTVVLRGADPIAGTLTVHTDLHSAKVASLTAMPRAAFHVWIEKDRLQLRLACSVTLRHGAGGMGQGSRSIAPKLRDHPSPRNPDHQRPGLCQSPRCGDICSAGLRGGAYRCGASGAGASAGAV